MGGGPSLSSSTYRSVTASYATKPTADVFSSRSMKDKLNPFKIRRESRDPEPGKRATPIFINFDVTGSMGSMPDHFVRHGLGVLVEEIMKRQPVSDPQICFGAIGDVEAGDAAPYQVSQFESDVRIIECLTDIYLEGRGGGNKSESYHLPYYFAANKIDADAFSRGQKGFLFTIGDEPALPVIPKESFEKVFGDKVQADIEFKDIIAKASQNWSCYHIQITEGNCCDLSKRTWKDLLGQRVIPLDNYKLLAETIISLLEIEAGKPKDDVINSWDGSTSLVISGAIKNITSGVPVKGATGGIVMM